MSHTRIKYIKDKDADNEIENIDDVKGWHLQADLFDGEFTACGNSIVDYANIGETKEKGGITCKSCLQVIQFYKSIKL